MLGEGNGSLKFNGMLDVLVGDYIGGKIIIILD